MPKIPYPYHLCSAEQCRRMDERTISEFGIDGFTLMEVAGTKAADFILNEITQQSKGLFLCGKGNNAGDALVIARILSEKNHRVDVCFVAGSNNLSPNTSKNLTLLQKLIGSISFVEISDLSHIDGYDFIVDGMLGTGLNSEIREPYFSVITTVNTSSVTVFALDIATGLHPDSGRMMGTAIKADFTLTFGALKTGLYLNHGFEFSGEIVLCELPFPNHFKEKTAYLISNNWISNQTVPVRNHKYDGGVLYIIAGSEGLTGAAILAAKSAWNTGIGAVVLITPKGLLSIYEKNLVQIIKKPVGTAESTKFTAQYLTEIQNIIAEKQGKVLIGPGLGMHKETIDFVQQFLANFEGDCIIDADALFALSKLPELKKPTNSQWILTPHIGELKLLMDADISDDHDRLLQVSKFSNSSNITIVSKGFPCIVSDANGDIFVTSYDTRIFSRAGFGDILAGKISANFLLLEDINSACFKALLEGKQKADFQVNTNHPLEPLDLI